MDKYTLNGSAYLHPTPAGAFFAVSRTQRELPVTFLQQLLREETSPALTAGLIEERTQLAAPASLEFLLHLQEAGLVEGRVEPASVPRTALQTLLPGLLGQLSGEGRALLADATGMAIGSAGYSTEAVDELSALAADMVALHARHADMLDRHLRLGGHGWGVVAPAGYSELACWPLRLGDSRFILLVGGEPRLNQPAFTQLAWVLGVNYAG